MVPNCFAVMLCASAERVAGAESARAAAGSGIADDCVATWKSKIVIFLFQWGGPSHVDTFDMKPDAPDGYRSLYKSIPTSVPNIRICEHLPETAKVMHRVAQIRTVHHNDEQSQFRWLHGTDRIRAAH